MKIVQITTDSRVHYKQYEVAEPYFGTAPAALITGFCKIPGIELHVISCTPVSMNAPVKLADNIWFHQPVVGKWGWGRSLFQGCVNATRKLLRDIRPEIVHGQGTERDCAISAVRSGYPNVLTIHGNMRVHAKRGENKGRPYYKLAALLEGIALRATDGVISISSYTDALVKPLAKRTWLLPNAADPSYFEAAHSPTNPPVMLFVGGLDERKNPISFIHACADLFNAHGWILRLCGTGNPESTYYKQLQALAAEMPWIELAGWKSREELRTEMERASALVLPTLEDNCPMVILEAMAVGLPVLASKVGGIPDLVEHGITGLMFDPLDPISIHQATGQIMNDAPLRNQLGTSAKEVARQRFHPQIIAEKHLEIYREVLGK